ncbi:PRC-barrel domain-containing protein [Sphingomonas sp.]|uniref:PRC-barrel domain-containing protein n=1 Tax=Sphingomonas sp. TaxID=28214 RepID=UPI002BAAF39A|nr:PRC-barrel domain-containing protein [Sphingomonas sp.]HTG37470.1 PRC-barrel domain-containing protein [Sphingomonas sp.]
MPIAELAGWIAPAATMIAAMMTAANLGARVTGWGFVVFSVGSVAWSIVGVTSGQTNLLLTNGFLTVVNAVGIWRWLGRQARYDKAGARAQDHSARENGQDKFAMGHVVGAKVVNGEGETIGQVVDAMLGCRDHSIEYLVISCGGVGGVGETLHAVEPDRVAFRKDAVRFDAGREALCSLPELKADDWPGHLPRAA